MTHSMPEQRKPPMSETFNSTPVASSSELVSLDDMFDKANEYSKILEITTAQVFIKALTFYFDAIDSGALNPEFEKE